MSSPTKNPPHPTNTPRRKPTPQPGCLPPLTVRMSSPQPHPTHHSPPNSSPASHTPHPRPSRFYEHLHDDTLVVAKYPPGYPLPSPSPSPSTKKSPFDLPAIMKRHPPTTPEPKKSAKTPLHRVFSRIAKKLKEQRIWSGPPVEENACSVEEFLALGKISSTAGGGDGGMRGGARDGSGSIEGLDSQGRRDGGDSHCRSQSCEGGVSDGDDRSETFGELNGRVGTIDGADIRGGRSVERERGVREEEEEVRLVAEEEVVGFVKVSRRLGVVEERPMLRTAQSLSFAEHLEERLGAVEGSLDGSGVVFGAL